MVDEPGDLAERVHDARVLLAKLNAWLPPDGPRLSLEELLACIASLAEQYRGEGVSVFDLAAALTQKLEEKGEHNGRG